jgi:hypothetical protein
MAKAFAGCTKRKACIIIIGGGGNKATAESIITSAPKPTVESDSRPLHESIHCGVTLMKNVQAASTEVLSKLYTTNFLMLSQAFLATGGRDEIEEGNDKSVGLKYYVRWKFIHDLMPLLGPCCKRPEVRH